MFSDSSFVTTSRANFVLSVLALSLLLASPAYKSLVVVNGKHVYTRVKVSRPMLFSFLFNLSHVSPPNFIEVLFDN